MTVQLWEDQVAVPSPLSAAVIDTGTLPGAAGFGPAIVQSVRPRVRTVSILVTTTLTWVSSGQPTVIVYACRSPFAGAQGATSQLPATGGDGDANTIGSTVNFGASGTSKGKGVTILTPQSLPNLQWPLAYWGLELTFPSAITGGAFLVFVDYGPA